MFCRVAAIKILIQNVKLMAPKNLKKFIRQIDHEKDENNNNKKYPLIS